MNRKNDFSCILFTASDGTAQVDGETLLQFFDAERDLSLMDYGDPRRDFAGRVLGRAMTRDDVARAIDAHAMFAKSTSYPNNYAANLQTALGIVQVGRPVTVKVDVS